VGRASLDDAAASATGQQEGKRGSATLQATGGVERSMQRVSFASPTVDDLRRVPSVGQEPPHRVI
jgi:hypothetical protein